MTHQVWFIFFLNPLDLLNAYMVLPPKVKVCDSSHFESKNSCEKKQEPLQKSYCTQLLDFSSGPAYGYPQRAVGTWKNHLRKTYTREMGSYVFFFVCIHFAANLTLRRARAQSLRLFLPFIDGFR